MELGYLLLAFDVVLAIALFVLARRGGAGSAAPRDVSAELRALEDARRAAIAATEEAWRARAELERSLQRAERFTQQWAEAALDDGRPRRVNVAAAKGKAPSAGREPAAAEELELEAAPAQAAEARIASALRALRRA